MVLLATIAILLSGCSIDSFSEAKYDNDLRAAVLSVPGITGGATRFSVLAPTTNTSPSPMVQLVVSSDAPTQEGRTAVLRRVLQVTADVMRSFKTKFSVDATIRGGNAYTVTAAQLGIRDSTVLFEKFP